MPEPVTHLVRFGRALRTEGIAAGPDHVQAFCDAVMELGPQELYWAGRATLTWRPEHIPTYDRVFESFFGRGAEAPTADAALPKDEAEPAFGPAALEHDPESLETMTAGRREGTAGAREILRSRSFDECTHEELMEVGRLMRQLAAALPRRLTRRYRHGRPGSIDERRTLRRASRTGGEPVRIYHHHRRRQMRPVVFLLDISGSMSSWSRGLLLFAHAVNSVQDETEVFAFGTQLTKITDAVEAANADAALRAGSALVPDWEGGTRIGASLRSFLDVEGRSARTRRAVAIVASDGLELGDPEELASQAARLRRSVHRVVWLNPLKQDPRYQPLARGMHAALPFVDTFASGHNLASLEEVLFAICDTSRNQEES